MNVDAILKGALDAITGRRVYGEAAARDRHRIEGGWQDVAALAIVATWAVKRRLGER